jgi:hypothetical protein
MRRSAMINNFNPDGKIKTGVKKKTPGAEIKALAVAILLQAMKDLRIEEERSKCINFVSGEGFHICSKIAGMSSNDKLNILSIVKDLIDQTSGKDNKVREIRADIGPNYELTPLKRLWEMRTIPGSKTKEKQ